MRKTMTLLLALALLAGFSGVALAGGMGDGCSYSNNKHQAQAETEKTKPVASKTDKADSNVALADVDKTKPADKK